MLYCLVAFLLMKISCVFSDFVIRQDYTISIDSCVIYRWYEDSKDGHLVTIKFKDQAPQIYIKEQYQMENGRFKLISRNEVSQGKKRASVKYTMLTT